MKSLREPWLEKETIRSNFRSGNEQQIQKLRMLVVNISEVIQKKDDLRLQALSTRADRGWEINGREGRLPLGFYL